MKSELPKALHQICGLPMVEHVARAMKAAGVGRPVIVVGHAGELVRDVLGDSYDYAWQREQLGTGHATLMAKVLLEAYDGPVVVAAGDTPLLQPEVFLRLVATHMASGAVATIGTSILEDPTGYGRVVRDARCAPTGIVEHKDASDDQKAIREIAVGLYCFDSKTLFRLLPKLQNDNAQGEYYLPDTIHAIHAEGGKLAAQVFNDPDVTVGVNDRWQLAMAEKEMRLRILKRHAVNGVTLRNPDSIFIEADVEIGPDTTIEPGTMLLGKTSIGSACRIGPYSRIFACEIGDHTCVVASYLESARVGKFVWIGPYAHLRPRADVGDRAKVGNFVEIKNARLATEAKVSHLSYIGDAAIGEGTNIGAGTITCNFDGTVKHRTEIGANAFVGSHSTLVAPVTICSGAMIAAGSVITSDVPEDAGAFGRARQENKEGWAERWRNRGKAAR